MQEEKETTTVQNKMQLSVILWNQWTRTHLANHLILLEAIGVGWGILKDQKCEAGRKCFTVFGLKDVH